jgi:hypothetical protein
LDRARQGNGRTYKVAELSLEGLIL